MSAAKDALVRSLIEAAEGVGLAFDDPPEAARHFAESERWGTAAVVQFVVDTILPPPGQITMKVAAGEVIRAGQLVGRVIEVDEHGRGEEVAVALGEPAIDATTPERPKLA